MDVCPTVSETKFGDFYTLLDKSFLGNFLLVTLPGCYGGKPIPNLEKFLGMRQQKKLNFMTS